jgi:hypothetical protein
MAALQTSGKICMLRFPDRPDALPMSLIWNFETTSNETNPTHCTEPRLKTEMALADGQRTIDSGQF